MLLTLGAAGATLLVMLAVLGIPAIDRCHGDSRGLVGCLRNIVDDKFDLGLEPDSAPAPVVVTPETPAADIKTVAETPAEPEVQAVAAAPAAVETPAAAEPSATPAPPVQVADAPVIQSTPEPTRSLSPPVADKPLEPAIAAPPQSAVIPAAPTPPADEVETAAVDQPDAAPAPETIALAEVVEPDAPDFVPPPPAIAIDGVPPDLQVAAAAIAAPAADIALPLTPDLPTTPPPDLVARAEIAVAATTDAPELPAPQPKPPVAAEVFVEAAPAFVLPITPDLPTTPPPDLAVAAVDPVVPDTPPPPVAAVLDPTIDAIEIDGAGNFIAGNGPAGATMRLYVDGIPVGVSPVEGGRWLVEGTGLLTEPKQTLKVEALDPLTGKVLGDATVVFERPTEPPPAATIPAVPIAAPEPLTEGPDAALEAPAVAEPQAAVTQPEPSTEAVAPDPLAVATAEFEAVPPTAALDPPAVAETPATTELPPASAEAAQPAPIPQIAPVIPAGETASVTILSSSGASSITTLTTGAPSGDAVITLGAPPKSPAIIARFTLPTADTAADVTILRAVPFGDPGAGRFVSGKAIIRRGDTLWDIAHRYYGHGIHFRTIVRANRELIGRPGKIYPGQVFDLPLVYDD